MREREREKDSCRNRHFSSSWKEVECHKKDHTEISVGVFPGIFYGYRAVMKSGGYISLGGGIVNNSNGLTLGAYNAFGYKKCGYLCFNLEYKQALGLYSGKLLAPYAIRIGVSLWN